VESTDGTLTAELVTGIYTITVTAYTGSAGAYTAVAKGSTSGVGVTSEGAQVSIAMRPNEDIGGEGTFAYNIGLPENASGTLKIIEGIAGSAKETIDLSTGGNSNTVTLDRGTYLVAVQVTQGTKGAGFWEAVHIYTGLTSTLSKTYQDTDFADKPEVTPPDPEMGSVGIELDLDDMITEETITVNGEGDDVVIYKTGTGRSPTSLTLSVTDYQTPIWHIDGEDISLSTEATLTINADDYGVGPHTVSVIVLKDDKPYAHNVVFTVSDEADSGTDPDPVTAVAPADLAEYLANLDGGDDADNPVTVVLESIDINSTTDWGTTVKNALMGLDKYIVLDLSACYAANNKIAGSHAYQTSADFNCFVANNASGVTHIVEIILPDTTITKIDGNAFRNISGIKRVTIPESVATIESSAFVGTNITTVTFLSGTVTVANDCGFLSNGSLLTPINGNNNYGNPKDGAGTYIFDGTTWTKQP
jgi:hypothetical protein